MIPLIARESTIVKCIGNTHDSDLRKVLNHVRCTRKPMYRLAQDHKEMGWQAKRRKTIDGIPD